MFRSITLAAFALVLGCGPSSAVVCEVYSLSAAPIAPVEQVMLVESGEDCALRLRAGDPIDVRSAEIAVQPRRGGARADGTFAAYYRSNPGYRGRDGFVWRLCGTDGGRPFCADVQVRLIVR